MLTDRTDDDKPSEIIGLPGLAKRINAAHAACMASARDAVAKAIAVGRLRAEAKDQVRHGEWGSWVIEHCTFGVREAQHYMKTYQERDRLEAKSETGVSHLTSLRSAVISLAEPRPAAEEPQRVVTPYQIVQQAPSE